MAAPWLLLGSRGCSAPSVEVWGGCTEGLSPVPSVSGAHSARAGRDAAAWQSRSRSRSSGAVPAGNGCGLSPHRPGAGTELCRAWGSPEGEEIQPGQPNPCMVLGWVEDAPGCCCSWPGASGIPDPALGTAPKSYGCPPSSVASQGVPVPRGALALSQSPSLGPAPEQWLGKPRVWSQGRERSRARSKSFQWFNCCGRAGERLPRLPWG